MGVVSSSYIVGVTVKIHSFLPFLTGETTCVVLIEKIYFKRAPHSESCWLVEIVRPRASLDLLAIPGKYLMYFFRAIVFSIWYSNKYQQNLSSASSCCALSLSISGSLKFGSLAGSSPKAVRSSTYTKITSTCTKLKWFEIIWTWICPVTDCGKCVVKWCFMTSSLAGLPSSPPPPPPDIAWKESDQPGIISGLL